MSKVKVINGKQAIFCPACQSLHLLDARWRYNYNPKAPTFKPEVALVAGPFRPGHPHANKTFNCNFVINAGTIHFLASCSHAFAGKDAPLPDFEEMAIARQHPKAPAA